MKNDLRFALLFSGVCFLILGAMLRFTFDAAWDAREEARVAAQASAEQIQFLRSKAVATEWKLAAIMKMQHIAFNAAEATDNLHFKVLLEIRSEGSMTKFGQDQFREEAMKRLNELYPAPKPFNPLDQFRR